MFQARPSTTAKAIKRSIEELNNPRGTWERGSIIGLTQKTVSILTQDQENFVKRLVWLTMHPKDREMVARDVTDYYLKMEQ